MKKILLFVLCCCFSNVLMSQEKVKFLLFSDLHYEFMPDTEKRLKEILQSAEKQKVDFIFNLGDLTATPSDYAHIKDILSSTNIAVHHALGNHDMDPTDKETYMQTFGLPSSYYYFDKGPFRFIVLDSNYLIDDKGQFVDYNKANYRGLPDSRIDRYGTEQIKWLETLLKDTTQICLIFSHAPVNERYSEVSQNKDIHNIITRARDRGTRIAVVFGGHIHSDNYHLIDGINYLQVNSASYIWGGQKFLNTERYPAEIHAKHPNLKYVIPYEDVLYAVVEIDGKGEVIIKGKTSSYIKPEPDPELLKTKPYPCSPVILDRTLHY